METVQQDILLDLQPQLVQAGTGKRLANYLIDFIVFLILAVVVVMVRLIVSPPNLDESVSVSDNPLLERLFWMLMYAIYMGLVEIIFRGRSIGKFITGTKVVNEDGTNISLTTSLARGFARIVPFEVFSALGNPCYPWHDKWCRTYVIDIKNSGLY